MSRPDARLYESLSEVLSYPDDGYSRRVRACGRAVARFDPELAAEFGRFSDEIVDRPVTELEELFTRTFDLNPACCLEVGWHLFGENYERGRFLVRMRQELRRCGLAESTEMPDHLAHVLAALARMDPAVADSFIGDGVLPAVAKMLASLEGQDNPFEGLLKTIHGVLGSTVSEIEEVAHV